MKGQGEVLASVLLVALVVALSVVAYTGLQHTLSTVQAGAGEKKKPLTVGPVHLTLIAETPYVYKSSRVVCLDVYNPSDRNVEANKFVAIVRTPEGTEEARVFWVEKNIVPPRSTVRLCYEVNASGPVKISVIPPRVEETPVHATVNVPKTCGACLDDIKVEGNVLDVNVMECVDGNCVSTDFRTYECNKTTLGTHVRTELGTFYCFRKSDGSFVWVTFEPYEIPDDNYDNDGDGIALFTCSSCVSCTDKLLFLADADLEDAQELLIKQFSVKDPSELVGDACIELNHADFEGKTFVQGTVDLNYMGIGLNFYDVNRISLFLSLLRTNRIGAVLSNVHGVELNLTTSVLSDNPPTGSTLEGFCSEGNALGVLVNDSQLRGWIHLEEINAYAYANLAPDCISLSRAVFIQNSEANVEVRIDRASASGQGLTIVSYFYGVEALDSNVFLRSFRVGTASADTRYGVYAENSEVRMRDVNASYLDYGLFGSYSELNVLLDVPSYACGNDLNDVFLYDANLYCSICAAPFYVGTVEKDVNSNVFCDCNATC